MVTVLQPAVAEQSLVPDVMVMKVPKLLMPQADSTPVITEEVTHSLSHNQAYIQHLQQVKIIFHTHTLNIANRNNLKVIQLISPYPSSFFPMQRALSSPTVSELLVVDPSAAPTESLDSIDPGQEEMLPEIQPEILTDSSQEGLTLGSNQHVVPSPPHLDTDDAPIMGSPPFQASRASPPSSFCSPPQKELPTTESPAEPAVQLQDTLQHQDPHQHQDSRQLLVSQWHIHPPAPQPQAQLQISVPVPQQQQQQPNATVVNVALDGDNSVAPQQTYSSDCQRRPPLAASPYSVASLLTPATPPAELTAALLVERNLATLDAPRERDLVQSSQHSSTKVLKPFIQQIKNNN